MIFVDQVHQPWGQGAQTRARGGSAASIVQLNKKYQTKVVGYPYFSKGVSSPWTCSPDLEEFGPHVDLELWSIIFERS